MADRSASQSGGVRNIRAMFEAKGGTDSSPPSRGRSPAASEGFGSVRGDSSSRPLSKVRASFVSVDRASGGLFPGLQRKNSDAVMSDNGEPQHSSRPASGVNGSAPPLVRMPSGLAGVREEDNSGSAAKSGSIAADTKAASTSADNATSKDAVKEGGIKGAAKAVGEKASELKGKIAEKAAAAKPSAISTKDAANAGSGPPSAKASKTPTTPRAATTSTASPRGSAAKSTASGAKDSTPIAVRVGRPSAANTPATQTKKAGSKPNAAGTPPSISKKSVETSPGGFVKPPPKSPTRPVKLPAGAMATTTASSARTGRSSLGETGTRSGNAATTQTKSTLSAAAPTIRNKPSRQSLAGSTSGADDSFLARMMRPTQSSASKTHEKVTEPQRAPRSRTEATTSAPKPAARTAAPKPAVAKPAVAKSVASKTVTNKPSVSKLSEAKSKVVDANKPKPKAKDSAPAATKSIENVSTAKTSNQSQTAAALPATAATAQEPAPEPATLKPEGSTAEKPAEPRDIDSILPKTAPATDEDDPVQSVPPTAFSTQSATESAPSVDLSISSATDAKPASADAAHEASAESIADNTKASPELSKAKPAALPFTATHSRNKSAKSINTPNSGTPFSMTPRTGTPIAAIVPLDEATLEALGPIEPAEPFLTGTVREKPSKYIFGPPISPTDDIVAEALSEPAPVPVKPAPDADGAIRQAAEIEMAANEAAQVAEAAPAEPVIGEDDVPADPDEPKRPGPGLTLPEARGPAPPPAQDTIADEDLVDLLSDDEAEPAAAKEAGGVEKGGAASKIADQTATTAEEDVD